MQERHLLLTFCPHLSPCPTFEDASFQARSHSPENEADSLQNASFPVLASPQGRGTLPLWERVVLPRSPPLKEEAHSPLDGKRAVALTHFREGTMITCARRPRHSQRATNYRIQGLSVPRICQPRSRAALVAKIPQIAEAL